MSFLTSRNISSIASAILFNCVVSIFLLYLLSSIPTISQVPGQEKILAPLYFNGRAHPLETLFIFLFFLNNQGLRYVGQLSRGTLSALDISDATKVIVV